MDLHLPRCWSLKVFVLTSCVQTAFSFSLLVFPLSPGRDLCHQEVLICPVWLLLKNYHFNDNENPFLTGREGSA